MKKILIVVMLFAVLFAAVSVVSAQTVENEEESKEYYYWLIDDLLTKIQECLMKGDRKMADYYLAELRQVVYRCAIFLAETNEYDVRIYDVLSQASKAFSYTDSETIIKIFSAANNISAEVLMGVLASEVDPLDLHS